jgi:hypothetical protein
MPCSKVKWDANFPNHYSPQIYQLFCNSFHGFYGFNGPYNHTMAICPNDVPTSHKKLNHYPIKAWGFSFDHSLGYN